MQIYTATIRDKRGHEFAGEWGRVHRRVWREERLERNVVKKL